MPNTKVSPDGYRRLVIWQPLTGFVTEVDFRGLIGGGSPKINKAYFNAGNGSDYEESIERIFEIETPNNDVIEALRVMADTHCPVCLVAFGFSKTVLWLDPTKMNLTPSRPGFGSFAGEIIRIKNDNYFSPIFDVRNLIGGFYWNCAGAIQLGSLRQYRLALSEDFSWGWVVSSSGGSPSINGSGVLTVGETAQLQFQFPCEGATIRHTGDGALEVLDASGNGLGSVQNDVITLPADSWYLRVTINNGETPPVIELESAGLALPARVGNCVSCFGIDPGAGDGGGGVIPGFDITCQECFVIYPSEPQPTEWDNAAAVDSMPGTDGVHMFTRTIRQLDGFAFTITAIEFLSGGVPATPTGAFYWVDCGLYCFEDGGNFYAQRDIDFCIVPDEYSTGAYEIHVYIDYDGCYQEELTLTYNVIP